MRTVLAIALGGLFVGCTNLVHVADNEACVVKLSVPERLVNCLGAYDVVYSYRNPPKPSGEVQYHTIYNPSVLSNYVPQQGSAHCYAAALATGFGALGVQYPQEKFASVISNECFGTQDAPLTFSQIVFSATRIHAPPGVWYADIGNPSTQVVMNSQADALAATTFTPTPLGSASQTVIPIATAIARCQPSYGSGSTMWARATWDAGAWVATRLGMKPVVPALPDLTPPPEANAVSKLDLYRPITWHFRDQPPGTVSGAIVPVRDSGHLIDSFFGGFSVVAGLDTGSGGGHVVVVQKLHVVVVSSGQGTVERHASGYIEWVEFADPQKPTTAPLVTMSGDDFLARSRFLFGLHQVSRQ